MIDQAGLLRYWSPFVQNDKVRDAPYIESGRQLGIAFCVNLDYDRRLCG
jgi:hypothetical protein